MKPSARSTQRFLVTLTASLVPSLAAAQVTEIIDSTGNGLGTPFLAPEDVVVDAAGTVYTAGRQSNNVFKITAGGAILVIADALGDGAGNNLVSPTGIAVDAAGNVYVTGNASDNAFKISPTGVVTEIIDLTGDGLGNPLVSPVGIAVDAAGNVFVAGGGSDNVFKITPGGVITEIFGSFVNAPGYLALDGTGNVFVTGTLSDDVYRITPAGIATQIIDSSGDGTGNTLNTPQGIATDAAGNVYVSGLNTRNVFRIAPGGAITEILDSQGDGFGNLFQAPRGLTVDSAGNVYATSSTTDTVFKLTPAGPVGLVLDATGDGMGNLLNNPYAVAVDAAGTLYVAGRFSSNVFKVENPPDPPMLVARWELDGDASAANDPAWDGIASAGVTFEQGRVGQAARFQASSEVVATSCDCAAPTACTVAAASSVDHIDSMAVGAANEFAVGLSTMAWILPDATGGSGVVLDHSQSCCGTCFLGFTFGLRPGTGVPYLELHSATGTLQAEGPSSLLEAFPCWTHVGASWDGSTDGGVRLFVDGVEVTATVTVDPGFAGLDGVGELPTRIGASHADGSDTVASFDGLIDHVSLYTGGLPEQAFLDDSLAAPFSTPPAFDPATTCGQTLMASVGVEITFDIAAADCDETDQLFLTGDTSVLPAPFGIPIGATLTPPFQSGNPVVATFAWTPTNNDIGSHSMSFRASDLGGMSASCPITIEVAECYLLLGQAPGGDSVSAGGHMFVSQLSDIDDVYPVTIDANPDLVVGSSRRGAASLVQSPTAGPLVPLPVTPGGRGGELPAAPGELYFAQVVMWNPEVFPTNPEQWSQGLVAYVMPSGEVVALPYGDKNGIEIRATVTQDSNGGLVLKFPFTIDGM